jgi:hypothetical protein
VFLDYVGNKGTITRNARMDLLKDHECPHHPKDETGDPLFDIRKQSFSPRSEPVLSANDRQSWWLRLYSWLKKLGR